MTKQKRRFILWTLIALFVAGGSLIIAYSLGYTIDYKSRDVSLTGGIFIKSITPDVSIFLDGAFRKKHRSS